MDPDDPRPVVLARDRPPPPLKDLDREAAHLADVGVRAAFGLLASGIEGFRSSHIEALAAHRTALKSKESPFLVRYGDIELVSLMSVHAERAERFVERVLGDLAGTPGGAIDCARPCTLGSARAIWTSLPRR